jgi:hypothetical protein
MLYLIP